MRFPTMSNLTESQQVVARFPPVLYLGNCDNNHERSHERQREGPEQWPDQPRERQEIDEKQQGVQRFLAAGPQHADRKSTRLNSSHQIISYPVFSLKKKKASRSEVESCSRP